jgi:transposase-like protein
MVIRRTKAEWIDIMDRYAKSGQTMAAWCRENDVNAKTLGAHVKASRIPERKQNRSADQWRTLIEEQVSSGMSRSAWCKKHGVNEDSMTSAVKRLSAKMAPASEAQWALLNPDKDMPSSTQGLTLEDKKSNKFVCNENIDCENIESKNASSIVDADLCKEGKDCVSIIEKECESTYIEKKLCVHDNVCKGDSFERVEAGQSVVCHSHIKSQPLCKSLDCDKVYAVCIHANGLKIEVSATYPTEKLVYLVGRLVSNVEC